MKKSIKTFRMSETTTLYKTKNITIFYLIALSLIALLCISAYILMQAAIYRQASDAPVINYAGRQRMLSQKLTKEALFLVLSPSLKMREHHRKESADTMATWSWVHNGLQDGDKEIGLPGNNSREVQSLFVEMEPYYQKIKRAVKKILTLNSISLVRLSSDSPLIKDIVEASPLYLEWMDRIVFQYAKEARARVEIFKRYETFIISMVLLLLLLEALLIFRPMVKKVRRTYENFQQTNKQLREEITERKKAESTIKAERDKLLGILNTMEDGVYIVNRDCDIEYINPVIEKEFGPVAGRKCYEYFHDKSGVCPWCKKEEIFEGKNVKWEWYSFKNKKHYELFDTPIKNQDGSISKFEIFHDITESKKATEALMKYRDHLEELVEERTQDLKAAQEKLVRKERLAILGQLTASVGHELRNPLGTIRSSIFSVKEKISGKGLGLERNIDRLERSISRCNRIIEDLLDFSRIHTFKFKLTAIDAWIESVLNEQNLPEKITLRKELASGVEILLDHAQFRRAIINVFDNACQAMLEGQSKDRKELTLFVRTRVAGKRLEILMDDTGPGIPSDVFPNIFEPLFSTKVFGVGLGLPIVKQIMEQHNGGVEINSKQGKGTEVILWLPIKNQ